MIWFFLSVEAIVTLHADLIDTYGGSHGLRDAGLLESAVMRAENKVNFDPEASVAEVAASLSFGLVKNHAFIDGNKRIGLAALNNFLALNGFHLPVSDDEKAEVIVQVASSAMSESAFGRWVAEHAMPWTE